MSCGPSSSSACAHLALALLLAVAASAENRLLRLPDSLLPLPLLNGPESRGILGELEARTTPQSGWLETTKGKPVVAVTFVSSKGHFLSKASEATRLERLRLRHATTAAPIKVRELRRDVKLDLVLGQAMPENDTSFSPVRWADIAPDTLGDWLFAPSLTRPAEEGEKNAAWQTQPRLGVLSAARRPIPGQGAAMGITMAEHPRDPAGKHPSGVLITAIADDSPARAAGLRAKDILIEVAGQPVLDMDSVNNLVRKRQPGEEIMLRLLRDGQEIARRVRLASRARVMANFQGEDYANGGTSIRTDDFPAVIQHDLPLNPADMGGPLFDLQGRAIGINIARADRISTFALPVDLFRKRLDSWLAAVAGTPASAGVKPRP